MSTDENHAHADVGMAPCTRSPAQTPRRG